MRQKSIFGKAYFYYMFYFEKSKNFFFRCRKVLEPTPWLALHLRDPYSICRSDLPNFSKMAESKSSADTKETQTWRYLQVPTASFSKT